MLGTMKSQWVGLGFLGVLACSSSESTPPAPAPDGGATPPGTTLTVWIYEQPKPGGTATPLAGATVAFDPPEGSGERVEVTTEADGKATATIDIGTGPATISATAPNHVTVTALEVSPEENKKLPQNPFGKPITDLVLLLGPNGKGSVANSVEIRGSIIGKAAPDNEVGIGSTGVYQSYIFPSAQYAARVPKGVPFSLMCFEGPPGDFSVPRSFDRATIRLFRVDHPAIDANTPFDIDASQGTLQQTTIHWKVELPGGDSGPLGGTSQVYANIVSFDSGANKGFFRHIAPTADKNAFDVEEVVAETDLAPELVRAIAAIQATDGAASVRQELTAGDGFVFKDYLAPPAVSVTKQTRADAIALDGLPEGTESVNLQMQSGNDVEWVVLGPYKRKPSGPIKLPAPPTGAQLPATLKAQIIALADFVELPGRPSAFIAKKISASRPITISK